MAERIFATSCGVFYLWSQVTASPVAYGMGKEDFRRWASATFGEFDGLDRAIEAAGKSGVGDGVTSREAFLVKVGMSESEILSRYPPRKPNGAQG